MESFKSDITGEIVDRHPCNRLNSRLSIIFTKIKSIQYEISVLFSVSCFVIISDSQLESNALE